jgi:hypothetical protein
MKIADIAFGEEYVIGPQVSVEQGREGIVVVPITSGFYRNFGDWERPVVFEDHTLSVPHVVVAIDHAALMHWLYLDGGEPGVQVPYAIPPTDLKLTRQQYDEAGAQRMVQHEADMERRSKMAKARADAAEAVNKLTASYKLPGEAKHGEVRIPLAEFDAWLGAMVGTDSKTAARVRKAVTRLREVSEGQ